MGVAMRVVFDAMVLRDFKSFRGRHYLDVGSMGNGVHFLKGRNCVAGNLGSNGSGKSTLWDALCWCLYGRTVEGLRNPDVRVWGGPKQTMVTISILVDGQFRSVQRTTNPNRLMIDDHEVGQEQVDALVGMSHKTFLHSVLLGQGQPLFLDLQPGEMLALFSEVLGLGRWDERSARARDAVLERKEKVQRLETDVDIAVAHVAGLKEHKKSVEVEDAAWRASIGGQKKDLMKTLIYLRQQVRTLKCEYDELVLAEDLAGAEARVADEFYQRLREGLDEYRELMIRARVEHDRVLEASSDVQGKLSDLGDSEVCPTCGRPVKGSHLESAFAELRAELKSLNRTGSEEKLKDAISNYDAHNEQVESARVAATDLTARAQSLAKKVRDAEAVLKDVDRSLGNTQASIDALDATESPFASQLKETLVTLDQARCALDDKREKLSKAKRFVTRYEFWVKGFKDIRLQVLGEVLAELEAVSNAMLDVVGLSKWGLTFAVERETKSGTVTPGINVEVHAPDRTESTKWKAFSGGERQRLRVVVALALSEVLFSHAGLSMDFVVLDEPTQHLSDTGVDDLVTLLAEFAQDRDRKVFYTDHHSMEGSRFASVLTVEKTSAGSQLVV
jgi:DNA repair exonuclease SbcCD ATPase subunit